jgi:hypothetical protein
MSYQSTRAYLNPEQLPIPGITGLKINTETDGRHYTMVDLAAELDPRVANIVSVVSVLAAFTPTPGAGRELGIYTMRTAKGVLDHRSGSDRGYDLEITAKTVGDARDLWHQIRTGAIRPTESYEAQQSGKSRAELETELKGIILRLKGELAESQDNLTQLKDHLRKFRRTLRNLRWPWSRNSSVVTVIDLYIGKEETTKSS